ncbi:amidase family protein [Thalassospira sp.]|uniref:amidase family protein n=1 Tax=Thalassospira sp. TaxID=1912094 RepID=UPI000C5E043A|nr:amidase family protein [Thalassospira sp.]MBC06375.1 glutamyl-tRNA amidotransferase [Thalassospira sp.]|tara:strand:- start:8671 stop:9945 length:1275 start_codon:yes stop_codon:yes gene_type:complete
MGAMVDKARQAIDKVNQLGDLKGKIFTEFDPDRILQAAAEAEQYCAQNPGAPLAGMLVSVKDLYDEAGHVTSAASQLLKDRAPAEVDCECVRRIKAAGAIPFGRTTMSEFAYSGVGLNPHYGTPGNIFDAEGIPGGSTSGGGLTVAHGLVDIALGTDTGGSIRIPSAINGLYGIKPSRLSVPGAGVHPLAKSFDTPGPLAADLATAIAAFEVLTGMMVAPLAEGAKSLRIGVPVNAFVDGLDARVQADFTMICERLRDAGHELVEVDLGFIASNAILNKKLVAFEAHRIYVKYFDKLETIGDPRVLSRMKFADTLSSDEVIDAYAKRTDLVSMFGAAMADVDVMIAPTLPMMPPKIAAVEADFDNLNAMMLRNTGYLNLVDACALSIPVPVAGETAPAALMIGAPHGHDQAMLEAVRLIDPLFG